MNFVFIREFDSSGPTAIQTRHRISLCVVVSHSRVGTNQSERKGGRKRERVAKPASQRLLNAWEFPRERRPSRGLTRHTYTGNTSSTCIHRMACQHHTGLHVYASRTGSNGKKKQTYTNVTKKVNPEQMFRRDKYKKWIPKRRWKYMDKGLEKNRQKSKIFHRFERVTKINETLGNISCWNSSLDARSFRNCYFFNDSNLTIDFSDILEFFNRHQNEPKTVHGTTKIPPQRLASKRRI